MKKSILFVLCLFLVSCGEKAEEKAFLDRNIKSFLEYDEIAGVTPKINLSNILTKMSELKLHIQDYKFSQNCQRSVEYIVENITVVQDMYKNFSLRDNPTSEEILAAEKAKKLIREVQEHKNCKDLMIVVDKRKFIEEQNNLLKEEVSKENPNLELVQKYITNGADVNARDKDDQTVLMLAIMKNKKQELIESLINYGADVNAKSALGGTVLMHAISHNNELEIINILIRKGANVNATSEGNWTALMLAAENSKKMNVIKMLIEAGADVNAKNDFGWTALIYALQNDIEMSTIELLIRAGADVNIQEKIIGWTPLMCAVKNSEKISVIEMLVASGADVKITDKFGNTALDYTQNTKIIKILKKHKSKSGRD